MTQDSTPVLVGCGEVTDTTTPATAGRSPFDLAAQAGRQALADTGVAGFSAAIDAVAMIRLTADTTPLFASRLGTSRNPPGSVARRLGIGGARLFHTSGGGNMPQYMVNFLAERIARGELRAAMIVGAEALRTQKAVERAGLDMSWEEDPGGEPEPIGDARPDHSDDEHRHGASAPIAIYPLFEHAIRGHRRRAIDEHAQAMGRLFARFAAVAAANPLAVRREPCSAERLLAVGEDNRWVGFPYPRLMNANIAVDQAAALVLTSAGEARRQAIPASRWVYLHGCADGNDHWYVSQRPELHASPAIRLGGRRALDMAGIGTDDLQFLDLYSCFPSAVEIACQELGIAEDDPRGLTLTGGLPFFGGPGNNYVGHSVGHMMRALRTRPGSWGLVTAVGNYLTKHSFGVYSTRPYPGRWQREAPSVLQATLDALPQAPLAEAPAGAAHIETYTVVHGRSGPQYGIVVGREQAGGRRFIANVPADPAVLWNLQDTDSLGRAGSVRHEGGRNLFVPG